MNSENQAETPLTELLDHVPLDARMWYEHEKSHHLHIPVGHLCRRASERIKELEALSAQDSAQPVAEVRFMRYPPLKIWERHIKWLTTESIPNGSKLYLEAPASAPVNWQPIETAPKDGTKILGWREDCGFLMIRWTCCAEFLTEREQEELDEDTLWKEDWFCADFIAGARLEGSEVPTHWTLLEVPHV